ncbi:Hypothetical protein D9617_6g095450 [Elsinoe fawcettii]|nr:Hypothetical protein D9617_6g095450 [Elsinoe fawcettii]
MPAQISPSAPYSSSTSTPFPPIRDLDTTPTRSIPTLLLESDYHLTSLSHLLSSVRSSPLASHTTRHRRTLPPPDTNTKEAEAARLRDKNDILASALNRAKKERNAAIAAEMEAERKGKRMEREITDLRIVVGLLEREVDRLSLGLLEVGGTPGRSPGICLVETPAEKGGSGRKETPEEKERFEDVTDGEWVGKGELEAEKGSEERPARAGKEEVAMGGSGMVAQDGAGGRAEVDNGNDCKDEAVGSDDPFRDHADLAQQADGNEACGAVNETTSEGTQV